MMAAKERVEDVTTRIFDLYKKHGGSEYIGEPVSQQSHMIQCAMLAEKEGFPDDVVLAAFLHDIGHLLGYEHSLGQMGKVGTKDHESIGENFLKELGFTENVTNFVRGHVDAKRYLVFKYSSYYDKLSSASKETLIHQGGPMGAEEAEIFEKLPVFDALLRMRNWDDLGKDPNMLLEPLEKYEAMCKKYVENIFSSGEAKHVSAQQL